MSESESGQPPAQSAPPSRPTAADSLGVASRAAEAPFALSQEPVTEGEAAAQSANGSQPPAPAYEHLGELPATYGTQSVYLVAYDPRQLFAYWDLDWSAAPAKTFSLHVCRADGEIEAREEIASTDAGRYLPIAIPGGTYFVELGTHGRDGAWQPLAFSARVTMPPEGLAGEAEPKFATLPFHLSFQRLLELISGTVGNGAGLTLALARLQHGDDQAISELAGALSNLQPDQLHTLEMLLGQKFSLNSGRDTASGGDSEAQMLRDRHDALQAGAFASEGLSSTTMAGMPAGGASDALFSGAFGSEQSQRLAAPGSLGSETLTSLMGSAPSSEAWRMASQAGGPGGSDLIASERAADFGRAIEENLGVLGTLFSAVNLTLGGDSSHGGSSDSF